MRKNKRSYIPFNETPENPEKIYPEVNIFPEYIKKTLKFKESDVLQVNIKYPVFAVKSNPVSEKKINTFYHSAVNSFVRYCEKNLYKSASAEHEISTQHKPFGAVVTFEIPYCNRNRGVLCVYLDINIYSGKGRGNITRKSQIWDIATGELYSPGRIINLNKPMKKRIREYILKTMEHQYLDTNIPEAYQQNINKYLNINNLYLSDNGYTFYYPQGTIAPHDNGIIDFTIPENVLRGDNQSNKKMMK